jgi:predicted DNA-binding protein
VGHTRLYPGQETAISVPDETFDRVERRAAELGMSRSQFYATAAARYLEELERASLTARINEALERAGKDPDAALVTSYSKRRLATDEDW